MKQIFRKFGQVPLALVGASAILVAALLGKDTKYENAWLYVFSAWLILYSVLEVSLAKKNKRDK